MSFWFSLPIIKALLFIGAGVLNALMDTLAHHYESSIFPTGKAKLFGKGEAFWNPDLSWHNKNRFKNKFIRMLFRTVLVWTTDPWHFFQFMMLNCFTLAAMPPVEGFWNNVLSFVVIRSGFSIGFTPFYDYILKRKNHGNKI